MNKEIMRKLGFNKEVDNVELARCSTCGKNMLHLVADMFRDELSRKEYKISGMCQTCQDKIFGE